ncbi:MAG: hypothetical protein ACHQ52_01870 [Candidatus Eisenbacteria bacterium]
MTRHVRRVLAFVATAIGVALILCGVLMGYAGRSLFNERGFADRVAASLDDPRVAQYVAERITDATIHASPDLVGVRPILITVTRSMVSSPPFRAAVRRAARTAHHAMMNGTVRNVALTVQDVSDVLQGLVAEHPALANKVPPRLETAIATLNGLPAGQLSVRLVRLAHRLRAATWIAMLLGIVFCAIGMTLATERRRALVRLGVTFTVLALALALAGRFGGDLIRRFAANANDAPMIAGLARAFLSGLLEWAAALGFCGLVLASAAASLMERVPLGAWFEGVRRWLVGPQSLMRIRLARGLLGTAIAAGFVFEPSDALTVTAWLAGVVLLFVGLREAFVAALHLLPEAVERAKEDKRAHPGRGRLVLAAALVVALVAVTAYAVTIGHREPESAPEITSCNGSPELCDRPLDQVVFPATHNSMGGADNPGWMFPNQTAGITRQLQDGVRAFLLDVHYGVPVGDKVKTVLDAEPGSMAKYESVVGKEGMDAAMRIRDRIVGGDEKTRRVYMCHGFCELGALELVPMLRDVRRFLVENPGEVLIFDIEDDGPSPEDVQRCFEESGLVDFVYHGPVHGPWPTLREMAASDQRVVVMAENHTGGAPWYHSTFDVSQETPYDFKDPSEFSNRPNRGGTTGSLLMMNHWIESTPSPKPSNAAVANAYDLLLARARACAKERAHQVNVVAVDFYGVGDLFRVVRTLNGLSDDSLTAPGARAAR